MAYNINFPLFSSLTIKMNIILNKSSFYQHCKNIIYLFARELVYAYYFNGILRKVFSRVSTKISYATVGMYKENEIKHFSCSLGSLGSVFIFHCRLFSAQAKDSLQ